MRTPKGFAATLGLLLLAGLSGALLLSSAVFLFLAPGLPSVEQLKDVSFQTPLRVYTRDGKLIGEFGDKRRSPIHFADIPPLLTNAIVAAEDDRFFRHKGVDMGGLARAALELARYREIRSGGSTITMQVARNFFLDSSQKFTRKFNEILLARQIERELTKEEILELYINKIYLGHRAYGVAAAAEVYYGKSLSELSLAQLAMIAGLPKAPSSYNPVTNPDRAMIRRDWILKRMESLGMIDAATLKQALAEPNTARHHALQPEVDAMHVADMVRTYMLQNHGSQSTEQGYRVFTTLDSRKQKAANDAVFVGLMAYDRRHGWRGPETHLDPELPQVRDAINTGTWPEGAASIRQISYLEPAIVVETARNSISVMRRNGEKVPVSFSTMEWARKYISADARGAGPKTPSDIVQTGDVIRVYAQKTDAGHAWHFGQIPAVQSALVSLRPEDGSIAALVGGFSYVQSRFNRAVQGDRQAGSTFKPFLYAAALDHGFTAASVINDAPIVFYQPGMDKAWRPENDSGKFHGPTRLRTALYLSRNLVSIRLLMKMPIDETITYISQLGIPKQKLPRNLSMALGTASISPLEITTGFSVFANGGFRVSPYMIDRIEDENGNVVWKAQPVRICRSCNAQDPLRAPQVMDERTAFIMDSMLQDVVKRGTATRAKVLGRDDIAGKTGTTNETRDAWFAGYHPSLSTTVWVGFDEPQTLGRLEYGGSAALPIWIEYMKVALEGQPPTYLAQPPGVVSLRIDPATGRQARPDQPDAVFEYFVENNLPPEPIGGNARADAETVEVEEIF